MSRKNRRSPCRRHDCDACCHDTRMSLTEADVRRLEGAGHRGFCHQHTDGSLRLHNVDGHCVFLGPAGCSAYADRPSGCVTYPLIWYTEDAAAGLHDFCPYRHEFRFTAADHEWLARSIAVEDAEVAIRQRRRDQPDPRPDDADSGAPAAE